MYSAGNTYPENHGAVYDTTSGRQTREEWDQVLLDTLLICDIAATNLHIDTLGLEILDGFLGVLS